MAVAQFYSPKPITPKPPSLPSFQSGANNLASLAVNPYAAQNYKNTTGYNPNTLGGPTPYKSNPYIVPVTPGGPSSNTAGSGATLTDANSIVKQLNGQSPGPGVSAYAAPTQAQVDAGTAPDDQKYMYNLMANDPTLAGELDALASQNQSAWSSYLASAKQAEIGYGGTMDPAAAAALGFSPTSYLSKALGSLIPQHPDYTHGVGLPSGSLMDALNDPLVLSSIAPGTGGYNVSALGQIAKQYADANNQAMTNLRARGIFNSGALGQHMNENLYQNNLANNTALQNFLGSLQTGYGSYLTGFGGLQTSQQQDVNTELQNIFTGIQSGLYTLPSAAAAAAAAAAAKQPITSPDIDPGGPNRPIYPNDQPPPLDTPYYFPAIGHPGVGTYSDANSTGGYSPQANVPFQGVPVESPGAAAPNHAGRTVGGYISGGAIRT